MIVSGIWRTVGYPGLAGWPRRTDRGVAWRFAGRFGLPRWDAEFSKRARKNTSFARCRRRRRDRSRHQGRLPLLNPSRLGPAATESSKSGFLAISETQAIRAAGAKHCGRLFERRPVPEGNFSDCQLDSEKSGGRGTIYRGPGQPFQGACATARRWPQKIPRHVDGSQGIAGSIGRVAPDVMLLVYLTTPRIYLAVWTLRRSTDDGSFSVAWMSAGVFVMRK